MRFSTTRGQPIPTPIAVPELRVSTAIIKPIKPQTRTGTRKLKNPDAISAAASVRQGSVSISYARASGRATAEVMKTVAAESKTVKKLSAMILPTKSLSLDG